MQLYLKNLSSFQPIVEKLHPVERVPYHVTILEPIDVALTIKKEAYFYKLYFSYQANISVCCQRCLESFDTTFKRTNEFAISDKLSDVDELFKTQEALLMTNDGINTEDILVDDFILYAPIFHENEEECTLTLTSL
jgi:uncharacterized metal-binding protein YceD (DUF177 family)